MPRVRGAGRRLPLRRLHLRGLQELLRANLQQPVSDPGVQEQLQVRGGQEEQDGLQGLQAPQVPHGRHVQVRLQVRQEEQLVQDTLHHAEPAAKAESWSLVCHINTLNILAPSKRPPLTFSTLENLPLPLPSPPLPQL